MVGNISKDNIGSVKLQGVPRSISLHVYRLSPDTTSEQVTSFLKDKFPEVKCEKLTSKHPDEYSSFRVDVHQTNYEKALDPNLWPVNTCVRRFLFPRQKLTLEIDKVALNQ